jgi:DNA-binding IclR family transcriptional regulator
VTLRVGLDLLGESLHTSVGPLMGMSARRSKVAVPVAGRTGRPKAKEDRHFVTALARGLNVLASFHAADAMLGNGELAARCNLPKSTVSRLTLTLERLGYLHYVENTGKYRLGTSTLGLGSAMLSRLNIRQLARPMMQEVADFSGGVVSLGVRVQLGIIYIETCRSHKSMTLSLDVGSRIPLVMSAIGRAYLASTTEEERQEILGRLRSADKARWPEQRRTVEAALTEYRRLGVATSMGDWQGDVNGIGIGVRPGGGLPHMALNCGGAAFTLTSAFLLEEVRPRMLALVRRLEEALGQM